MSHHYTVPDYDRLAAHQQLAMQQRIRELEARLAAVTAQRDALLSGGIRIHENEMFWFSRIIPADTVKFFGPHTTALEALVAAMAAKKEGAKP